MPGLFDGTPLERPVTCERCGKTIDRCACPRDASGGVCPPSLQPARVRREKRRGKFVTVVAGLDPVATDLVALAAELRKRFSTGGTVTKDAEIELQGDHRERLVALLKERGYPAKPAGG